MKSTTGVKFCDSLWEIKPGCKCKYCAAAEKEIAMLSAQRSDEIGAAKAREEIERALEARKAHLRNSH